MLTFGVLGVGYFGKHYVRLLTDIPGARLIASGNSADADTIINNPDIQCLIISAPSSQHFPLAQAALKAGKHILIEKPMVTNLKDAEALEKLAQKTNRVVMVGHQYFYNDYANELAKQIAAGTLGEVKLVTYDHLYPGPIRTDVSCLWDAGTHALALMDHFFKVTKIKEVQGSQNNYLTTAAIAFADGPTLQLTLSWFSPEKIRRITVVGTKGTAILDELQPTPLKIILQEYPTLPTNARSAFLTPAKTIVPTVTVREPLRNELEHFIDCVTNNKTPRTDIRHGVRITSWLETIDKKLYR